MERGRLAAIFVVNVEHRRGVHIVVLQRDELAVGRGPEPHALLSARTMADGLEHHLAAHDKLYRLAKLPRRRCRERAVRPRKKFAAETGADKLRDDADVFLRQAEHLCEHRLQIDDALRRLVQR